MEHDLRDVRLSCKDRRAHADEVHPAADQPIDNCADSGGSSRLLRLTRIVRDERQPRERHSNRQLERHCKAHRLSCARGCCAAALHNDRAKKHREEEEAHHCSSIHAFDAQDSNADPDNDEHTDDRAPEPVSRMHRSICRKRTVIDHDARPSDELQDVQCGKQQPAPCTERHLNRLHRTSPRACPDKSRKEEQDTADGMPDDNRNAAISKTKRCKECPREYLRKRDPRTEPYQGICGYACVFFHVNSLHTKTRPCQ